MGACRMGGRAGQTRAREDSTDFRKFLADREITNADRLDRLDAPDEPTAGAGAGAGAGAAVDMANVPGPRPGVRSALVIGAGISGLACAASLLRHGMAVTILEGRDRIGGRLFTDADGQDLGGHWIHGGGRDDSLYPDVKEVNPIRKLCDDFGLATKLTDGDR